MSIIIEKIGRTNGEQPSSTIIGEEKDKGHHFRLSGNLLIVADNCNLPSRIVEGNSRGKIGHFSASSGIRMRRYLRECTSQYKYMVTLTYPSGYERDGKKSKEQLRRFCQELRRFSQREGSYDENRWSIFWFMEFQERGAIHYHLFTTEKFPKTFVSRRWYEIVGSEDERHLAAGTRCESIRSGRPGTISYASKYAAKQEQKTIPDDIINAGRFWGVYGCRNAVSAATTVSAEAGKVQAVNRYIMKIKRRIIDGIRAGNIQKLELKRDGIWIYVIKREEDRSKLTAYINLMESVVMVYTGKGTYFNVGNFPELTDEDEIWP